MKVLLFIIGRVAEWYTRATQNRVPYGLRVQVPPCPPKYELPSREFLFWLEWKASQLLGWRGLERSERYFCLSIAKGKNRETGSWGILRQ